jgi:hypothetical protein
MRGLILGTGLLISLVATGFTAPVALAAGTAATTEPYLSASEEPLAPGQELQIQGYCPDPKAGPLTSDVLTDIQVLHDATADAPNLNASGVVADGTEPGTYTASMSCADQTLSTAFTVVADEPSQPPEPPAGSWLAVEPDSVHAGDTVTATAADCAAPGVLTSPVLETVTLEQNAEGHQPWAMRGTTTVHDDAEPGEYPVSVDCGKQQLDTTITVVARQAGPTSTAQPKPGAGDGQVSRVPEGAPETGGGADEHSTGLPLAAGLALGAGLAAGAIAWRRARP